MDPITPQPQEPQFQAPTPEVHGKKTFTPKFIALLVLLLIVGLGAAAGIWYWQASQVPLSVVTPVHKEKVDPFAGWKTYTNSQYGFEFKYPSDLNVENNQFDLFYARSTKLPLEMGGVTPDGVLGTDYVDKGFEIYSSTQEKKDIIIDITKSVPDDYLSTKLNIPQIDGYRIDDLGGITRGPVALLINPNIPDKYIAVGYGAQCDQNICDGVDVDKLFNQILSTFKFIAPSSAADTSTWKTYTNSQYGFEFKYPGDHTVYSDLDFNNDKFIAATPESAKVIIADEEKLVFCCESFGIKIQGTNQALVNPVGKTVTFAGKTAYESGDKDCGIDQTYSVTVVPLENTYVTVTLDCNSNLLNQIISTFKFTK